LVSLWLWVVLVPLLFWLWFAAFFVANVHSVMLVAAGCGCECMFGLLVISLVGCFEGVGLGFFAV